MTPSRVEVCMISTPDGVVEVSGRSGPLGGAADQARLRDLRAAADLVLVGAGTVRAERYGPPSREGLRIAVVTRSCDLDFSSPLFTSGAGFLVTTEDAPAVGVETVRAGRGDVDLGAALALIGAGLIHCEGGPSLNAALLRADLVDAVNLTVSPSLGGVRGTSWAGDATATRNFSLSSSEAVGGFLFLRYERVRSA